MDLANGLSWAGSRELLESDQCHNNEFEEKAFVLLQVILFNIFKVESRRWVIDFIENVVWKFDMLLQVYTWKQHHHPLFDLVKEWVEHFSNVTEVNNSTLDKYTRAPAWRANELNWGTLPYLIFVNFLK